MVLLRVHAKFAFSARAFVGSLFRGGALMETSVTKKGQTNIPAVIRKRHHIQEGDRLSWLDDGEVR
jgi:AbrB family looped-hinge helix DNA binding protein